MNDAYWGGVDEHPMPKRDAKGALKELLDLVYDIAPPVGKPRINEIAAVKRAEEIGLKYHIEELVFALNVKRVCEIKEKLKKEVKDAH